MPIGLKDGYRGYERIVQRQDEDTIPASISATMGHGPWSLCQCLRCEMRPGLALLNGRSVCRTPRQRAPATAGTEPPSAAIELLHSLGVDVQGDPFVGRCDQASRDGCFRVGKEAAPHRHAGDPGATPPPTPRPPPRRCVGLSYRRRASRPRCLARWLLSRVQVAHVARPGNVRRRRRERRVASAQALPPTRKKER